MKCGNCGCEHPSGARTCDGCGTDLSASASTEVVSAPGLVISIEERKQPSPVVLFRLSGSIDGASIRAFQHQFAAMRQRGHTRVVVDMKDLKFINSSGLRVLITCAEEVRALRGDLLCADVPEKIQAVFQLLDPPRALFRVVKSVPDALRRLA
jgi:anti-sigma B factor antagonist